MLEENAPIILVTSTFCWFCGRPVSKSDDSLYRQVESWVHGPKLDHPILRKQTGNYAHEDCIKKELDGQAPDQEALF